MRKISLQLSYTLVLSFLLLSYVSANTAKSTFYEGTKNHINYFQLSLSTPLNVDSTVNYQTQDGTAVAGSDYIAASGITTIPAGENHILIPIEIIGDTTVEEDETFSLVINNPTGGIFPEGVSEITVTHTILNDDIQTRFNEKDSNHINYFLLEIDQPLSINASVDYQTRDGTAVAGQDYTATSGTVTIPVGETKVLIAVQILGDFTVEEDETFDLVLSNPIGGIFPAGVTEVTATHSIINDDVNISVPVDNTQLLAKILSRTMLSGIPPILTTQTVLDQPDDLANAFAINITTSPAPLACPSSGTFEYIFTDANADLKYSTANDNLAITANQCNDGNITSNGSYNLKITNVAGTITTSEITLNNVSINDGTTSTIFTGLLTTAETVPLDASDSILEVNSTNLQLSSDANYVFSTISTKVATESVSSERKIQTYTTNVTLTNSSNNGTYHTEMVNTLKIRAIDTYPYEGKLIIQRQDAVMNITLTVLDNAQVKIETDTSGDNIADYTQTVAWSELSSGF
jgi:hypothetical protein